MRRILFATLLVSAALAQKAPEPPKGADEALRARVKEFYQYHVTQEYRKAEQLVAEDAKDIFYVREKPKYESFEIKSIQYGDRFQKAEVTVTVAKYGHEPGFNGQLLKTPSLSWWKVVRGKWMWYVPKEELERGPMGKSANAGTVPLPGQGVPEMKVSDNPALALGHVELDKSSLVVKPGATEHVTITNNSLGTITLTVRQVLPDIKVTLDKTSLNRGEKAVATLKCGENPNQGEVQFQVMPTSEVLVVQTKR